MPDNQRPPIDYPSLVRSLCRAQKELIEMVEAVLPPPEPPRVGFVPNAFQQGILAALNGVGLRTDALASRVGSGSRSRLFERDGLPELQEEGLVCHHKRIGYYRPDAPPPGVSLPPPE